MRVRRLLAALLTAAVCLGLLAAAAGPAGAGSPSLRLSPRSGPPTSKVTAKGAGFGTSEIVVVDFGTTQVAETTTSPAGRFSTAFKVPAAAPPGRQTVTATGQTSKRLATARFLVNTNWSQFRFGPAHTGVNRFENVLSVSNVATLATAWRFSTSPNIVSSSPAVANGVVYVGSEDGNVYALDAATGAKLWSFTTGGVVASSPAVANGVVYVGSFDHRLYALNAATGAKLWSFTTAGEVLSPPAVANGVVYVGSGDRRVYALNAVTGARLWSFTTGDIVDSSPAVAGGVVYVGSGDRRVYALNAATGARLWSFTTGNSVVSSPAVAGGVVYVGSEDNNVYALNAATGARLWSFTTGNFIDSSPAVANGAVYVGSGDGNVYAFHLP
jgi:outer membrane protein assembly factor BamB